MLMESNEEERFWLRSSKPLKFGEQAAACAVYLSVYIVYEYIETYCAHFCEICLHIIYMNISYICYFETFVFRWRAHALY